MIFALALLLVLASTWDIRTRRIPNGLAAAGLAAGFGWHFWHGDGMELPLTGIAAALPLLLLYGAQALGAGDVKLLMAVGALMGPVFLGWTLLGAVFAGGALAAAWLLGRSIAARSLTLQKSRMPLAPAIALGSVFALEHLKL